MKEHFMKTEVDWEEEIQTHCIFVEQSSGDLCHSEKKKASESLTIEETHSMTLDSPAILLLSIKLKK